MHIKYTNNKNNKKEFIERSRRLKALYNLKKNMQHANTQIQIHGIYLAKRKAKVIDYKSMTGATSLFSIMNYCHLHLVNDFQNIFFTVHFCTRQHVDESERSTVNIQNTTMRRKFNGTEGKVLKRERFSGKIRRNCIKASATTQHATQTAHRRSSPSRPERETKPVCKRNIF